MMKLVVRTNYRGSRIRGEFAETTPGHPQPFRWIMAQPVFEDLQEERRDVHIQQTVHRSAKSALLGCCPFHGIRGVNLTERHFLDTYNGNWNLYFMKTRSHVASYVDGTDAGTVVFELLLAPENQTSINVKKYVKEENWEFWGSLQGSILRMDLEPLLYPLVKQSKESGRRDCHTHIFVLMDSMLCTEPSNQRGRNRHGHGTASRKGQVALKSVQNTLNLTKRPVCQHRKLAGSGGICS